jgi:transposase-like protein
MHLLENKPISEICEGEEINPTLFYQWQKAFFENGTAAFERSGGDTNAAVERKLHALESRLRRKDEVIAEVTEELIRTKKELGSS